MIRRHAVVPAPPGPVWEFLTEPEADRSWLGGRLTWTPQEGGELRFEGQDGRVRRGVVHLVRPPRYLRFRWWPEDGDDGPATEVSYLLEPDGGATRLTVSEQPVAPTPGATSSLGWSPGDDRHFRAWAYDHGLVALG